MRPNPNPNPFDRPHLIHPIPINVHSAPNRPIPLNSRMTPPRPPPSSTTTTATEADGRLRRVTEAEAATSTPEDSSGMKGAREHFVNVLKGFIGSNYLSVPFAFSAAGMLLGPIAVCAVAAISGAY